MKARSFLTLALLCALVISMSSCSLWRSLTGSGKTGCPSSGKNVGAERILTGEKTPKAKKFRA